MFDLGDSNLQYQLHPLILREHRVKIGLEICETPKISVKCGNFEFLGILVG